MHHSAMASFGPSALLIVAGAIVFLAVCLLLLVASWKVFEKAGQKGWVSLVPLYRTVKMLEITNEPLWWIVLFFVPVVNLFLWVIVVNRLSQVFGHGRWYTVGLIFLPFIFLPILAFGSSTYRNTYPPSAPMSETTKWTLIPTGFIVLLYYFAFFGGFQTGAGGLHPLTVIVGSGDGSDSNAVTGYATDGGYVYDDDQMIPGADPGSFAPLGDSSYATDYSHVYYGGEQLVGADPTTFKLLQGEYAEDAYQIYYSGTVVPTPDIASFKDLDADYAIDSTDVYYDGAVIKGADPTTFVSLGDNSGYMEDAHAVYYYGSVVVGADPKTFTLVTDPSGNATYDSKDKNHYYSYGTVVR